MGMGRGRGSSEVRMWLMLSEGVHGLEREDREGEGCASAYESEDAWR